jgi:hypothetical protein
LNSSAEYSSTASSLINQFAQGDASGTPYSTDLMDNYFRATSSRATRSLKNNVFPEIDAAFAKAGMTGSSRAGTAKSRALGDMSSQLNELFSQVAYSAFENERSRSAQARQTALQSAMNMAYAPVSGGLNFTQQAQLASYQPQQSSGLGSILGIGIGSVLGAGSKPWWL